MLNICLSPIKNWDIMSIIYSLVASIIFYFVLAWFGVFKKTKEYFKNKKAISNYIESIKEDCNSLIVVGKRKGFSLVDVYVPLDLAQSDLMSIRTHEHEIPNSYVVLGGPGAGKSTTAKNTILDHLENPNIKTIPFFIKLKDLNGSQSIYDFLVGKFGQLGFANPFEFIRKNLSNHNALCVLDGLDEVRPHLRKHVCDSINFFYAVYFENCGSLIVTCRKEAYRDIPLNINTLLEVRPLSDEQIKRFAEKWPLEYPKNKSPETFFGDLSLSQRILEIARSPLLLVGGLMHYTEANLGIPEERFEYLQTMAKWLVVDWATAQGHAPDHYRNVYDRILTSLALAMHKSNKSEILFDEAKELIGNLLPSFGYRKEEAETILNLITIKTGILIKDGLMLFFAQFGLQEYFVSKELFNQNTGKEIADLSTTNWWRESILLFIAQQKEPSELLVAILKKDPILGVAAIAECPTPSLSIQEEAALICLANIDKKNKAIQGSLIPFLRKVKDRMEVKLISELEKRLTNDEEISSLVGISLASAGTNSATDLLAKHPEIWHICLKEAGYLSSNFENLLVDWIQKSDDINSIKAADLLAKRITSDRLLQLLDIIHSLSKKKKEHLSKLLLEEMMSSPNPRLRSINENLIIISRLVPNISNPKSFIKEISGKQKNRLSRYSLYSFNILLSTVVAFFFKKDDNRCTTQEIIEYFGNVIFWQRNRNSLIYWLLSVCSYLTLFIYQPYIRLILFFLITFSFFMYDLIPHKYFRYLQLNRNYKYSPNFFTALVFYLLGALSLLIWGDFFNLFSFKNGTIICILCSSALYSLFGFERWEFRSQNTLKYGKSLKNSLTFFGFKFPININFVFFLLIVLTGISQIFSSLYTIIFPVCIWIGVVYLLWLIVHIIRFIYFWFMVNDAEIKAYQEFDINFEHSNQKRISKFGT